MRATIWQRSISLALAVSLAALPALAHDDERGHGPGCTRREHARPIRGDVRTYTGRGWAPVHWAPPRPHPHHGVDTGDVLLAVGATGVALAALSLWTHPPQAYANAPARAFDAPVGAPVAWSDGGARVVAMDEGLSDRGEYCREFQKEILVGGRRESGWGVACRQPDGSWRIDR